MLEPQLATWDLAAPQVVVEEAGGRCTTFEGGPLGHERSMLATNGLVHDEVLRGWPLVDASQPDPLARVGRKVREHRVRGGDILHADAGEIDHRQLIVVRSPGLRSGTDQADLDGAIRLLGSVLELSQPETLLERVDDEQVGAPEQLGIELLLPDTA
jgi:Archaeal fructose-1,6-bisphosphatase and related enzymes of inositol monophosphatase family